METEQCYICYEGASSAKPFANEPCGCKGTIKIHNTCLLRVMEYSEKCQTCDKPYTNPIYYGGLRLIQKKSCDGDRIKYTVNSEGKEHGLYRIYDANGDLITICTYINGELEGVSHRTLGYVYHICEYINGKENGFSKKYYIENDKIYDIWYYKDGIWLDNVIQVWHPNGHLQKILHIEKNWKFCGPTTTYHPSGKKKTMYKYVYSKINGILREYDEEGNIFRIEYRVDGGVVGLHQHFYTHYYYETILAPGEDAFMINVNIN